MTLIDRYGLDALRYYLLTYAVQDSSGQWSDPYSVTIKVERPNLPPVAMFTTDKETG